jgi:adenine/guanine phosphoribosyltransferase-like PRPP-binding protein
MLEQNTRCRLSVLDRRPHGAKAVYQRQMLLPKVRNPFQRRTTILGIPDAFRYTLDHFSEICSKLDVDAVVCIEDRSFLFQYQTEDVGVN